MMVFNMFTMNDIAKPTISFCDKTKKLNLKLYY